MTDIQRIDPGQRFSLAVVAGETVYLAGQVADDLSADVTGQTQQILAKIDALLAKAGTSKARIVSVNIWLADISTAPQMNAVWDAWVDHQNLPARATVEAKLVAPNYLVEIAAIALK